MHEPAGIVVEDVVDAGDVVVDVGSVAAVETTEVAVDGTVAAGAAPPTGVWTTAAMPPASAMSTELVARRTPVRRGGCVVVMVAPLDGSQQSTTRRGWQVECTTPCDSARCSRRVPGPIDTRPVIADPPWTSGSGGGTWAVERFGQHR
jgi:hypothetical protein